jgi:hypothetical protein
MIKPLMGLIGDIIIKPSHGNCSNIAPLKNFKDSTETRHKTSAINKLLNLHRITDLRGQVPKFFSLSG